MPTENNFNKVSIMSISALREIEKSQEETLERVEDFHKDILSAHNEYQKHMQNPEDIIRKIGYLRELESEQFGKLDEIGSLFPPVYEGLDEKFVGDATHPDNFSNYYVQIADKVYNVEALLSRVDVDAIMNELERAYDEDLFPANSLESSGAIFLHGLSELSERQFKAAENMINIAYHTDPRVKMAATKFDIKNDTSLDFEKQRRVEQNEINAFVRDYGDSEGLKELLKYWGLEGYESGYSHDMKKGIGDFMSSGREMFPDEYDRFWKDEDGNVNPAYTAFKLRFLLVKIEKIAKLENLQTLKEGDFGVLADLVGEIDTVNGLIADDKNIIDYIYKATFKEGQYNYRQNDADLVGVYQAILDHVEGVNILGSTEERNNDIKTLVERRPESLITALKGKKMVDLLNGYKNKKMSPREVVEDFMSMTLSGQIGSEAFEKKKIISSILSLEEEDKKVLKLADGAWFDSFKAADEENQLHKLDELMVTKRQERLQGTDFKNLSNSPDEFADVYKDYVTLNRVLVKNDMNARSFLVDLQNQDGQAKSFEGNLRNSFAFINRNFPDILSGKEVESIYEEIEGIKGDNEKLAEYAKKLTEYEEEVSIRYDDRVRSDRFASMAKTFFFENGDLYVDMSKKDTDKLSAHYSRLPEERMGFTKHMVSKIREDENVLQDMGITNKKNIASLKEFITQHGDSKNERDINRVFDFMMSLKAEEEIAPILAEAQGSGLDERSKREKLAMALPKYETLRKRDEKSSANIMEDYFRGISEADKTTKVKNFLHYSNLVIKKVDDFVGSLKLGNPNLEYRSQLTELIDDYLEAGNEGKLLDFLSSQEVEKEKEEKSEKSSEVSFSDFAKVAGQVLGGVQERRKNANDEVAKEYNMVGYSLVEQSNFLFSVGYESVKERYLPPRSEFAGNAELNELIGLRLFAERPQGEQNINTEWMSEKDLPLEHMSESERCYIEYRNSSESEKAEKRVQFMKNAYSVKEEVEAFVEEIGEGSNIEGLEGEDYINALAEYYEDMVSDFKDRDVYKKIMTGAKIAFEKKLSEFNSKHSEYIATFNRQRDIAVEISEKKHVMGARNEHGSKSEKKIEAEIERLQGEYNRNAVGLDKGCFSLESGKDFFEVLLEGITESGALEIELSDKEGMAEFRKMVEEVFEGHETELEISNDEKRLSLRIKAIKSSKEGSSASMKELIQGLKAQAAKTGLSHPPVRRR